MAQENPDALRWTLTCVGIFVRPGSASEYVEDEP